MYSNMKYNENICNCLRVIQQNINRKLKSASCWQQTILDAILFVLEHFSCEEENGRQISLALYIRLEYRSHITTSKQTDLISNMQKDHLSLVVGKPAFCI